MHQQSIKQLHDIIWKYTDLVDWYSEKNKQLSIMHKHCNDGKT